MVGTILKGDLQSTIEDQLRQYASGLGQTVGGGAQAIGDTFEDLQRAGRTSLQDVQAQLQDHATQVFNATLEAQRQAEEQARQREEERQQQAAAVQQQLQSHANQVLQAGQQTVSDVAGAAQAALPHGEEPATAGDTTALGSKWKTQFDFGATYTGDYRTGTPHRGVDLVPSSGKGIGTEVDAFTPGTVTLVQRDSGGAGGLMVYVQDADGLTHAYMHLARADVKVGDQVQRGTPIAQMGESGTEGSPHLHYEVRKNAASGDPLDQLIDPRPYEQGTKQPGQGGATATPTTQPTGAPTATPTPLQAAGNIPAAINVPINQGPSITRDQAIQALQGTPLQSIAGDIYDLGVQYNVDPAFALSVAKNESAYGDPSVAPGQAANNNVWDISNALYGGTPVAGSRWGQYPSKLAGAEAFYRLIVQEYYPKGQTTIGSVMWGPNGSQQHAYAPLSENAQDYPTRLINTIRGYGGEPGTPVQAAGRPPGDQTPGGATTPLGDIDARGRPVTYKSPLIIAGQEQPAEDPLSRLQQLQSQIDSLRDQLAGAPEAVKRQVTQPAALQPGQEPASAELGRAFSGAQRDVGGFFSDVGTNLRDAFTESPEDIRRREEGRAALHEDLQNDPTGLGTAALIQSRASRAEQQADATQGLNLANTIIDKAKGAGWQPDPQTENVARATLSAITPMNVLLSVAGGGELNAVRALEGLGLLGVSAIGSVGASEAAKAVGGDETAQEFAGLAGGLAVPIAAGAGVAAGRAALERPGVQAALRTRQPAQAEVGFAAGLGPGEEPPATAPEGAIPPRPPDRIVPPTGRPLEALQRPSPPPENPPAGVQRLPNYEAGTPEAGFEALARASRESSADNIAHIDLNTVPQDVLPFSVSGEGRGIVKLNPGGMPTLDDLRALYRANEHKSSFYVDQGDAAGSMVGPDNTGELHTLNAINSMQTGVSRQVAESIQAIGLVRKVARDGRAAGLSAEEIKQNILDALGDPKQNTLAGPALNNKRKGQIKAYETGESEVSSGAKTSVFSGNYTSGEGRFFDPRVTNDVHNWRIMNVSSDEIPALRKNSRTGQMEWFIDTPHESAVASNDKAYRGVEAVMNELAREMGVDGYAAQSAMWDGMRAMQLKDPTAYRMWQQGLFSQAIERAQRNGVFGEVTDAIDNPGDIQAVMKSAPVQRELAKWAPYLKDPLPPELGIDSPQRIYAGKQISRKTPLLRPSSHAFREAERAVAESDAPLAYGLNKDAVDRLGFQPETTGGVENTTRGTFPWLESSHRVVRVAPDEYVVHLPGGNEDTARYVAAQVGRTTNADATRIHIPDYRSDSVVGVSARGTVEEVRRLQEALDNMGVTSIRGTTGRSLQIPLEQVGDLNTINVVQDAAMSVDFPQAGLARYTGRTADVPRTEYGPTNERLASTFAPTTAERSALLERGVGVRPEEAPPTVPPPGPAERLRGAVGDFVRGTEGSIDPVTGFRLGGAAFGAAAGGIATPADASSDERLRNIGLGALAGLGGTYGLSSGAGRLAALAERAPGRAREGFRAPERPTGDILRATTQEPPGGPPGREPTRLEQVQSNRYALREPRPGETPMTTDEMLSYGDELEQRIQDVQARRDAIDEMIRNPGQKVERPPWAVGYTNDQVAAMARSQGISPFEPLWWEKAGLETGSGEVRDLLREGGVVDVGARAQREMTTAELRRERTNLDQEMRDITSAYDQMSTAPADARLVRATSAEEAARATAPTELPFDTGAPPEPTPATPAEAGGGMDQGARLAQEIVLSKGRGTLRQEGGTVTGERGGVRGSGVATIEAIARATETPPSARTEANMPNLKAMLGDDMEGVAAQIRKAAEDNPDLMEAYRQGRISMDSLKNDLARRVGMSTQDWLKTPVGKGFNEQEMVALQAAAVESQGRSEDLARSIVAKGGVDALTDEELMFSTVQLADSTRLLAVARGGRSTAGRTLNALKQRFDRTLASGITAANERIAANRTAQQARRAAAKATIVLTKGRELEQEATTAKASASRAGAPRNILQEIDQAYADLDKYNAMTLHEKADVFNQLKAEREKRATARKAAVRGAPEELLSALRAELKAEQDNFAKRKDTWETMAFWDSKQFENAMQKRTAFRGQLYIEQQRKLANIAAKTAEKEAARAYDAELQRRTNQGEKARKLLESIGDRAVTKDLLRNFIAAMDDPDPGAAAKFLKGMTSQSNWARANTIRVAGLLSAPITHMINLGGNTAGAMVEVPTRGLVVGIDAMRAAVTGGERQAYMEELLPMIQAYGPGFLGKLPEARRVLQTGISPVEMADLSKVRPQFGVNPVVDVAVEMPLRALTAEDVLFRGGATAAHGMRVAIREAKREGFSGRAVQERANTIVKNLEDYPDLAKEVSDAAARQVFQEHRALPFIGERQQGEAERLIESQVVPFVRTPANITAQGLGMSPLGFGTAVKAARGVAELPTGTRAERYTRGRQVLLAEERAARAMIGTGILGAGLALGAAGMLTANYPDDPQARSDLPQGWRPWAFRIEDPVAHNTYYIPLQNLGPMGTPLAMAAILTDPTHRGKTIADPSEVGLAVAGIGKYVLDSTFLQGLSDFVDMFQDPAQNAPKFLEGLVASYGPYSSLGRETQRAFGVATRNPREGWRGLIDAMEANYPGASGNVPPARTPLGDERYQGATGLGRLIPYRYDVERDEPTLKTLRSNGIGVPQTPRQLNVVGGHIDLTEDERAQLQVARGQAIRQVVARVESLPQYQRADAGLRAQMLQENVQFATKNANDQFLASIRADIPNRKKAKEVPEPYYLGGAA